jgi:hypothetical protein
MTDLFVFNRPELDLPHYLKEKCRDLRKYGFCILEDGFMRTISRPDFDTAMMLQRFQEACRWISVERDQNIITDSYQLAPHILIALAPKGHPGELPEKYVADDDGRGVMTGEPLEIDDPDGEQLVIDTKFRN